MLEAVFLDRDGVINEEVDYLCDVSELRLIPGASEAIKKLNDANIIVIVISNQSAVARGYCSEDDVRGINARLEELLGAEGARLDEVFFCPHHPGPVKGEGDPHYVRACKCRKPEMGMIRRGLDKYDISIENCALVGDTTSDIETGRRAGCRTVMVRTGYCGADKKYDVQPDHICENIKEAVDLLLRD